MPTNVIPLNPTGKYAPPQPAIKPDDPEMMDFYDLDHLQIDRDELARKKLAGKRREMLKTDLTWKQVLLDCDPKKRFNEQMLIGISASLGYEYFCTNVLNSEGSQKRVFRIIGKSLPDGQYSIEDTGLVEDDINEIL